jgi:hypothetical protein
MGWLCDQVVRSGTATIANLFCPKGVARVAFGNAFIVRVDRVKESRFPDTNRLFEPLTRLDLRLAAERTAKSKAEIFPGKLRPAVRPRRPTNCCVDLYQPLHADHKALIEEGLNRVRQVCILVRDMHALNTSNPLAFLDVRQRIKSAMAEHAGRFHIQPSPNIPHIFCGRDVSYAVERIDLDIDLQQVLAPKVRRGARTGVI